jgi:hypothetical protein
LSPRANSTETVWPSSRNSVWTRCVKLLNALASSKTLILAPSIGSHESLVRGLTIFAGATLARPASLDPAFDSGTSDELAARPA